MQTGVCVLAALIDVGWGLTNERHLPAHGIRQAFGPQVFQLQVLGAHGLGHRLDHAEPKKAGLGVHHD